MTHRAHTRSPLTLAATTTLVLLGGALHPRAASAATYYVATSGNNSYAGTETQPFQTIRKGLSVLRGGDTLYVRGGTYKHRDKTGGPWLALRECEGLPFCSSLPLGLRVIRH